MAAHCKCVAASSGAIMAAGQARDSACRRVGRTGALVRRALSWPRTRPIRRRSQCHSRSSRSSPPSRDMPIARGRDRIPRQQMPEFSGHCPTGGFAGIFTSRSLVSGAPGILVGNRAIATRVREHGRCATPSRPTTPQVRTGVRSGFVNGHTLEAAGHPSAALRIDRFGTACRKSSTGLRLTSVVAYLH